MTEKKKIIITGGTGFIGSKLTDHFLREGMEAVGLGRGSKIESGALEGALAVINLAGENIAGGRWTEEKKRLILESRVETGWGLTEAIRRTKKRPEVFIQQSAVGFYGSCGEHVIDEGTENGEGFLAEVAKHWEASTKAVEDMGVRRVITRSAVVLGPRGGFLSEMIKPFEHGLGGIIGGSQWFSWIHMEDEIRAFEFLIKNKEAEGIYNLSSPGHIRMKEFGTLVGRIMGKRMWLKVPPSIARMMLGEMADELILTSQRVLPKRLAELGFKFIYTNAITAIADVLKK